MILLLKYVAVLIDLCDELVADVDTAGGLAKLRRQRATLIVVQVKNQRSLPRQRRANRLGIDVGIAIHVTTNPGGEFHYARNVYLSGFVAVNSVNGAADVFIERWHSAI